MIENILGSKIKIKILRKLIIENMEITFEEIGRTLSLSFGSVYPAINSLVMQRIIIFRRIGRSKLYSINKKHILFKELHSLFESEKEGFMNIAKSFAKSIDKKNIKNIVLFGSVAREEFTEKSDIDLLVIYIKNEEDVKSIVGYQIEKFLDLYDVEIVPVYISLNEFFKRRKGFDRFILNIINEGKILYGDNKWLEK